MLQSSAYRVNRCPRRSSSWSSSSTMFDSTGERGPHLAACLPRPDLRRTYRELVWQCYNRACNDASIGLKSLVLRSLLIALIFGPLTAFATTVQWVRGPIRYDPPISEVEWRQLTELPPAKMALALQVREVHLTRSQWLASSVGHSFFWFLLWRTASYQFWECFLPPFASAIGSDVPLLSIHRAAQPSTDAVIGKVESR
jgi:hypothetical protein